MPRLALARREGQELEIGSDVRVKVVTARNGKARLCITAPASVTILRPELSPNARADLVQRTDRRSKIK